MFSLCSLSFLVCFVFYKGDALFHCTGFILYETQAVWIQSCSLALVDKTLSQIKLTACILAPLTGRHGPRPMQCSDRWLAMSVLLPPWQGRWHSVKTGLGTTSSVNFRILCKFGKTSNPTLIGNEHCPTWAEKCDFFQKQQGHIWLPPQHTK